MYLKIKIKEHLVLATKSNDCSFMSCYIRKANLNVKHMFSSVLFILHVDQIAAF